jgi:hypothetical protein
MGSSATVSSSTQFPLYSGSRPTKDGRLSLVDARGLRSRCLGNSSPAHSLLDDWQAENKQYTQNKSNRIANRGISII